MALEKYNSKRHFDDTPEPKGTVTKPKKKKTIFVVQRHNASRLHYDFRLEADGVLKSWAVPKGPSLNPKDRRLAVRVEDHPGSYADFEGDIPAGNYGAGHVDIWDHGTYEPHDENGKIISEKEFLAQLRSGNAKFLLKGEKLNGSFALVQMKGKGDENWLLIKHRDEYASDEPYNSEDFIKVATKENTTEKRSKKNIGSELSKSNQPATVTVAKKKISSQDIDTSDKAVDKKFDEFIAPMMAKLHGGAFDDPDWIFEIKWDGYRAIADVDQKKTKLYSRNGLSFQRKYTLIYDRLKDIRRRMVLDGEIVAFNDKGLPDFQILQQYGVNDKVTLAYYVFDILYLDGEMLENKPLLERKKILKSVLPQDDVICYCDDVRENGRDFFDVMKQRGLEGMIAKKANSLYYENLRTDDWLKIKQVQTEEALICGYTAPRGARKYFGSVILGMYEKGRLKYIGHSGTGFNSRSLKELYTIFQNYRSGEAPFHEEVPVNAPVTWLRPELVCNIKYTEITQAGIRRQPVFLGLRIDKDAESISVEEQNISTKKNHKDMNTAKAPSDKKVNITHSEKLYFPDEGYTKGHIVAYYEAMSKYILKYLKDRPESLRRNPNGIKDEGFFHKDVGDEVPAWIETYPVWSDTAHKTINYMVCNNKQALLYMANMGCIEINPWNSRTVTPEHPDYLVLDLDPSEKNTFDQVIETAQTIHEILEKAGCANYCKTSGASGLHVYIPLGAKYDYEQARMFAEMVATLTVEKLPGFTTIERALKKREKDDIYIDYLQNKQGQTLCCPYSVRPKPGATVSTPLEWNEVKPGLTPQQFHIGNILRRVEKKSDLFAPILKRGINMDKVLKQLEA